MTKVLVDHELLKEIANSNDAAYAIGHLQQRLHDVLAQPAHDVASVPSLADAYVMGATGGPVVDGERLAFEEWMRGHCWALCATWNGTNYVSDCEQGGSVDGHAMRVRMLWAAWRDRAALVTTVQASVPTFPCESCGAFHSYSEVSEAGGYCPQCEADYDERKMFADLLARYAALESATVVMPERIIFPTILRKMWSGGEVQKWLDEYVARLNRSKT